MLGLRQLGSSLLREFDGSFPRFVAVGLSNFAISFSVFRALLALPWALEFKASVCQLASYAAGTIWSFVWNRRFTFRSKGLIPAQALRFVSLQTALALGSAALIGICVDALKLAPTPSWLVIMGGMTIINFLLSKRWVFR
jgi:putative flippase GtrA